MSDENVNSTGKAASRAALRAVWSQWSALTSAAVPPDGRSARSIVDPEALVLASLLLRQRERRLTDLLAAWAERGAPLLSVQRMRSLLPAYPESVREGLQEFSALAAAAGDKRWERHAGDVTSSPRNVRKKDLGPLHLLEGPALMLRLRAGFGIGAKADVLAFLLGLRDAAASLAEIASATAYTTRAIRMALDDMLLAGFVTRIDGAPPTFYASYRSWMPLLAGGTSREQLRAGGEMPAWRFWAGAFAFLADVMRWEEEGKEARWSSYISSSRARDVVERHEGVLKRIRISMPRPTRVREGEYGQEFHGLVRDIGEWIEENV